MVWAILITAWSYSNQHTLYKMSTTTGEEISVKKQTSGVGKEGVLGWKVVGGGRAEVEGKAEVD